MNDPLLYRLAVAFGIGLIVGLERGWKTREEHGGTRVAGIRSFALAGLRAPGIEIKDAACVSKSFPHFFDVLSELSPGAAAP